MPNLRQISLASLVLCAMLSTVKAQENSTGAKATPTITVNASAERIRVTAPSSIVQLRLEVYAASGEKVFDEELRGANVFDWHLQNGQAQRLLTGDYVCVVTAKSVSGKLTQKTGAVTVAENSASVKQVETLSAPQAQAIGPVEENSSWTIVVEGENQTTTVIASNGSEGQMIRGRGALSFRIGNFFSGIDQEQMRLTETGNLGIGTSEPKARLDVAGTIRAERFVVARPSLAGGDKTGTLAAANSGDSVQPLIAGTGTANQIAKWIDNAGTLGDSGITETGVGNVGIGTVNPVTKLDVAGITQTQNLYLNSGPNAGSLTWGNNGFANWYMTGSGAGSSVRFKTWDGTGYSDKVTFQNGGNVGIGTSDPATKLDVAGITQTQNLYLNSGSYAGSMTWGNNGFANWYMTGSGAGSSVRFKTWDGAGYSDKVTFQNNGNVGIGTNQPAAKLAVAGNVNFTGFRTETTSASPNVIGGRSDNGMAPGVVGGTISGGGTASLPNRVSDDYGTVGGGGDNLAGNLDGTTFDKPYATVGGGSDNYATGSYSTIGGGSFNAASGNYSTVPGGQNNIAEGDYTFAAGRRARASNGGSFVWADSTDSDFISSASNQFLIRAGGGVGIGTNAPGYMLDVVGRSRIRQNAGQTGGTNSAGLWLFQNTPAADRAFVGMESDNSVGFFGGNGGGWGMIMNTQNGNVGIGTTGPLFKLQVLDQSNSGLRVQTNTAGGTVASFGGFGDFQIDAAGGPGSRLTVKENGFVGIGLNNPDRALVVNGAAAKPGGGSWDAFSDERLKTIKGSFTPGLKAIMQLQPLRYEYKPDNAMGLRSSGEHIGFGAQAVQKIIPEAVTKNDAGYLLVNNDPILWTMLNAIKEQQKEIEARQVIAQQQQDQIAALRTQNAALNARLQMIERSLRSKRVSKRR